jgi:hypothetical protein
MRRRIFHALLGAAVFWVALTHSIAPAHRDRPASFAERWGPRVSFICQRGAGGFDSCRITHWAQP